MRPTTDRRQIRSKIRIRPDRSPAPLDIVTFRYVIYLSKSGKGSLYSITERRVPELIPVLGSQPAGDVNHKPSGRLPLLSARPAVTLATLKRTVTNIAACLVNRGAMGVNSLPKTVTRQRRGCDSNPGPSAPESSTLTTRLPSHQFPSPAGRWMDVEI